MTDPSFMTSKITYCFTDGPVDALKTLHRAWAPHGIGWLTSCDDPGRALSVPDGVPLDSKHFVICRRCFPPKQPSSS